MKVCKLMLISETGWDKGEGANPFLAQDTRGEPGSRLRFGEATLMGSKLGMWDEEGEGPGTA